MKQRKVDKNELLMVITNEIIPKCYKGLPIYIVEYLRKEVNWIASQCKKYKLIADFENQFTKKSLQEYIYELSAGDLRSAYNLLEISYYASSDKVITIEHVKKINSKPVFFHDKNEDGHYDVLSAFQKSIRGSDVNAALHYLARLIEVEDLDSIYRRMSVIAYEDIGLANPSMGPKVDAAINASERLGLPEARIVLSTVVIELALSPKSNSAESAIDLALNDIRNGNTGNVPDHIKTNSPDYLYPHNYKNAYVSQQYLPDNIKNRKYYIPKTTSKYEQSLKSVYDKLNELNKK